MTRDEGPLIKIRGLKKSIGNTIILGDLDFNLTQQSIYGLIGKNGAGKTTLLRIIAGLYSFEEGEFHLGAERINPHRLAGSLHQKIAYCPSNPVFYGSRSAALNLRIACHQLSVPTERITTVLQQVSLSNEANKLVRKFSTGMLRRLSIARALLADASIVVLDEPSAGLDPGSKQDLYAIFRQLVLERQKSIIVSSHDLADIGTYCTHVGFLSDGVISVEQSLDSLLNNTGQTEVSVTVAATDRDKIKSADLMVKFLPGPENNKLTFTIEVPDVPELVRHLIAHQVSIYEITESTKSLTDLYAEIIK